MSKFIDKLNRASQTTPQPMGFRTTKSAQPKHQLQLVVTVTDDVSAADPADYISEADAGLLRVTEIAPVSDLLEKLTAATPDTPWGVWLEGNIQGKLKEATNLKCDFIVFSPEAPLVIPEEDETGVFLKIETSIAEGPLRTLSDLPVDAVLVTIETEKDSPLTWHHLMLVQRLADLVSKPLVASIPAGTNANELQLLWEAGIDGVLIETGPDLTAGEVTRLRKVIDELELPATRKRQKLDVLIPRAERDTETAVDIDEEDDE